MSLAFPSILYVLSEKSQCPWCPLRGEEAEDTLRWHSYDILHWIPAQPDLRLNPNQKLKVVDRCKSLTDLNGGLGIYCLPFFVNLFHNNKILSAPSVALYQECWPLPAKSKPRQARGEQEFLFPSIPGNTDLTFPSPKVGKYSLSATPTFDISLSLSTSFSSMVDWK